MQAHTVTPGVLVPEACTYLYYLASPLGFTVSFLVHWGINRLFPPVGLGEKDDVDYYGTFTAAEAEKLGVAPHSPFDGEEASPGIDPEKDGGHAPSEMKSRYV